MDACHGCEAHDSGDEGVFDKVLAAFIAYEPHAHHQRGMERCGTGRNDGGVVGRSLCHWGCLVLS